MQINMSPICRLWIFRSFTPSAALPGRVRDHHRFLLKGYLDEWNGPGARIAKVEQEIKRHLSPFQQAVSLWQPIPGMDWITAATLVAEIGVHHRKEGNCSSLAINSQLREPVAKVVTAAPRLRNTTRTKFPGGFESNLSEIASDLRRQLAMSRRPEVCRGGHENPVYRQEFLRLAWHAAWVVSILPQISARVSKTRSWRKPGFW